MTRILSRLLVGFAASLMALSAQAQRPITSVTYTPEQQRVEGDSPVYHFHIVDIKSPSTVTPGVPFTPTITWNVQSKPAGATDAEALQFIDPVLVLPTGIRPPLIANEFGDMVTWTEAGADYDESIVQPWLDTLGVLAPTLTFDQPNQTKTVGVIFRGSPDAVSGSYGYQMLVEDWPREDEGIIRNAGTFINATLGDPVIDGTPPIPAIASPGENELFTYIVGGPPVSVPFLVTGQAEENYPITDFSVSISDRGDVTSQTDILGLNSPFVTGSLMLDYTVAGLYDVTVTAVNSVGEGFTSIPFEVVRVVPPPTIEINTPTAGQEFTFVFGSETGADIPLSVTATTLEDGGAVEGIQTLTAQIGGESIVLNNWSIGELTPTGTADWFAGEGTYTLIADTTTVHGSASDSVTFSVRGIYPDPTVEITSPADGASFQRIEGEDATLISYTISGGISFGIIETVSLSITSGSGDTVNYTSNVNGEGTAAIDVDGIITALGSDSFTITVTVTSDQGRQASDSVAVVVNEIVAAPPAVSVTLPNGPSYVFESGSAGATIPVDFLASTEFGVIDTLTAKLDTDPVTDLSIDLVDLLTPTTTGTSELLIAIPGSYTITATATTAYGQAVASTSFTVEEIAKPTVTILTPDDGFTVNRFESDPASEIEFTYASSIAVGSIEQVEVTVNGTPFVTTTTGVGTASVTGIGTLTSTDTESFVIVVTVTSDRGETAFDQITVNVVESSDPGGDENCEAEIIWLGDIRYGKILTCGDTLNIRFKLRCKTDCEYITDDEVVIAVSEEPNGEVHLYSAGSSANGDTYQICGLEYRKNFPTIADKDTEYRVEIFRPVAAGSDQIVSLGSKLVRTSCKSYGGCKSGKSDKSGKSGKSNKSDKSSKWGKSDKSDKSDKWGKSNKSDKSNKWDKSSKWGKSDKSDKSAKSSKWGKSDKSNKSDKSSKWGKSDKSDKSAKSSKWGKSNKSDKSNKSAKSSKWGKSDKSDKSAKSSSWGKSDKSDKSSKSKTSSKSSKSSSKSSSTSWWGSWGWGG